MASKKPSKKKGAATGGGKQTRVPDNRNLLKGLPDYTKGSKKRKKPPSPQGYF